MNKSAEYIQQKTIKELNGERSKSINDLFLSSFVSSGTAPNIFQYEYSIDHLYSRVVKKK